MTTSKDAGRDFGSLFCSSFQDADPMNPYEPPKRLERVKTSFGDQLLILFLWILMPITMAYFLVRDRDNEVSLLEDLLMEVVCRLQWPIAWMCIVGYGVYLWVV